MEETVNLRFEGRAVELAGRDGAVITRGATARRGQLVIGRRLLEERAQDDRGGRPHRRLSQAELCALHEAIGDRDGITR